MSPMVVAKLSGQQVRPSGMWTADMMAIGSVFFRGDYFMADTYHAGLKRRFKAAIWDCRRITSRPVLVWGSGFLQYPPFRTPHFMRKFKVSALRGCHTRQILETYGLISSSEKIAYGDPGILFADLFGIQANPKYDLGIIPHKYDLEQGWDLKLDEVFRKLGVKAKIINVAEDPIIVVSQISECARIISSSLHGLIVADSLGIPNLHLVLSTLGHPRQNYELKFRDYYSAYGVDELQMIAVDDLLANPLRYMRKDVYRKANIGLVNDIKNMLLASFATK